MHKALRAFGWLGVVWSVFVGVLGILAMLGLGGQLDPVFFLWVLALFIVSVRLIYLRRWAAGALSVYTVWMIADSLQTDLPLWSIAWVVIAAMLSTMTVRSWRTLRPGW